MRHAWALAVILLVAGCVTAPEAASTLDAARTTASGPLVDSAVVLDPEGGHGEPSLGVSPDGTLFANGRGGRGGGVYRSTDDGASWTRIATPVEPMPNFDPDLAVDVDGNVWFSALWIGCTATAVSRDGGESWTANPAACNTAVADRQYVIPTEGGTAYLYSHQLPTFYQMAAKTTDHGRTWIPTAPIELPDHHLLLGEGSGWGGGGFWNRATGSVVFTWTWESPEGPVPGFAITRDEGATWSLGNAPSMGGRSLGLGLVVGAADDAGNMYLSWAETLGEGTAVYVSISTDDGLSWGEPLRVDDGEAGSRVFPAITAGPEGRVAIAYYESSEDAYPSDVEGSWNVTLAWTTDALSTAPTFTRGTLSPTPVKAGGICIDGTTCQGDREFADYFQIRRLPDGRVGAIYNSLLAIEGKTVEVYAATRDAVLV